MQIFDFKDYKKFFAAYLKSLPRGGRGELKRLSTKMRIHSTTMSQIFNGSKELTLEQAVDLGEELGFNDFELDYWITLILWSRAGSDKLRKQSEKRLRYLRDQHKQLSRQMRNAITLDSDVQAQYFSNWYYAAIHVATSLGHLNSVDLIADKFHLSKRTVQQVVGFLVQTGLCQWQKGKLIPGETHIHLGTSSNYLHTHRLNWHVKALERIREVEETDLVFSSALSVGKDQRDTARQILAEAIAKITELAKSNDPDTMMIFNVDWIEF